MEESFEQLSASGFFAFSCFSSYTFCHGRIGEIRPLILLGLGRPSLEGFCHSHHLLVDVVDDAALLLERLL
jgi:hypothetical protein